MGLCLAPGATASERTHVVDLASVPATGPALLRLHGSEGDGALGVSVAGGADCDGDGHPDVASAAMLASPEGIDRAGTIYLLFGDGTVGGTFDTAAPSPRLLHFHGSVPQENAGSEIWMDDVTGDGLGDLLIARQNFAPNPDRPGVGALSIVAGSPALRSHAASLQPIQLDAPPADVTITTIIGSQSFGRLGIWVRTGDIDGDGIADVVVGADQERHGGEAHSGAVYVIRGGPHLASGQVIDFGSTPAAPELAGHWLRLTPPAAAFEYHFGSTVQIADLDGNGRGEVLVAAALNRAGATLPAFGGSRQTAHGSGGAVRGSVFIAWDDNFPSELWEAAAHFAVDAAPGSWTSIAGGFWNLKFGEELLGGADYDGDGRPDLFVGDIVGDLSPQGDRPQAGSGHIFFDAAKLKNRAVDMRFPPIDIDTTEILGADARDIAGDTATHGDFDGDGRTDLAIAAPHARLGERLSAGAVYVFFGRSGRWPATIDLRAPLALSGLRATTIYGANGQVGSDSGDTLAYSAAAGDLDGDGRMDLILNEMEGNGLAPSAIDVGNLIVLSGTRTAGRPDGNPCPPLPRIDCRANPPGGSVLRYRTSAAGDANRFDWSWQRGVATTAAEFGDPVEGDAAYALCLYDEAPNARLVAEWSVPNRAACTGYSCWIRTRATFVYRDPSGADGAVRSVVLRPGLEGRAALRLRARPRALPDITAPLEVQFHRLGAGGGCWSAHFESIRRQNTGRFTARRR